MGLSSKDQSAHRIQLDRCDLLADSTASPVAWADNGIQFSAHPLQPQVVASIFPSTRTFTLPPPPPIIAAPLSYGPPSLLAAINIEREQCTYLFAYFPPRSGGILFADDAEAGGLACFYSNAASLADTWNVVYTSHFLRNAAPVACRWLGVPRRWRCSNGVLQRSPHLGPPVPSAQPTLLAVTQSQHAVLFAKMPPHPVRVQSTNMFTRTSVNLRVLGLGQSDVPSPARSTGAGLKLCTAAAIGLGYNVNSVLVATQTVTVSSLTQTANLDISSFAAPDLPFLFDDENTGESEAIELCEIAFTTQRQSLVMRSFPLAPIHGLIQGGSISSLQFIPRAAEHQGEDALDVNMYLAVNLVDFHDHPNVFSSRIELIALHLDHNGNRAGIPLNKPSIQANSTEFTSAKTPLWRHSQRTTRRIPRHNPNDLAGVIMDIGVTEESALLVTVADADTSVRLIGTRGAPVGNGHLLQLPTLEPIVLGEPAPVFSLVQAGVVTVPLSMATSPNNVLLCCQPPRTALIAQPLPISLCPSSGTNFAIKLAVSLVARRSYTDLIHIMQPLPLSEIREIQSQLYTLLESHLARVHQSVVPADTRDVAWQVLQVTLALNARRITGKRKEKDEEEEWDGEWDDDVRWKAGRDLCSLLGCATLFSATSEGLPIVGDGVQAYDPAMLWSIISAARWIVDLCERLVRECIYLEGSAILCGGQPPRLDDIKPDPGTPIDTPEGPQIHPLLLLLLQPVGVDALAESLGHIDAVVKFVKMGMSKAAAPGFRGENAYVAQKSLLDIVELTPVKLGEMRIAMQKVQLEVKTLDAKSQRMMLFNLDVPSQLKGHVQRIASYFTLPGLADKPRLFFDSNAQVDVTATNRAQLSGSVAKKRPVFSVLTRMPLAPSMPTRRCARCGGRAEQSTGPLQLARLGPAATTQSPVSGRNAAWLQQWISNCPCGGQWLSAG